MPRRSLTLTAAQWSEIIAHVQAGLPNEACGLLGGVDGVVRRVYPAENIRRSPWEYQLDPQQQVRAMLEMEAQGWELVGIFHSHPGGPPLPSATDVARAYYPESIYLILALDARGEWRGRGFRIEEGRVQERLVRVE
ncbi:MAG: Mov34/MPN/PAD-1 family protein [Anaerolineales bacterium]